MTPGTGKIVAFGSLFAVLAVGNIGTGVWGYKGRRSLDSAEQELQEAHVRVAALSEEKSEIASRAEKLERELRGSGERLEGLQESLTTLKSETARLNSTCLILKTEKLTLETQRSRARAELEAFVRRLAKIEQSLTQEQSQNAALRKEKTALDQKLDSTKSHLAQATTRINKQMEILERIRETGINVERRAGLEPVPEVMATVVKIQADVMPPVLVLDAGGNQGVEVDDLFYITRAGKPIGRARVERVTPDAVQARVIATQSNEFVRSGDRASTVAGKP